jgi:uncharacterized protein (TIGR02302 family)
MASRKSRARETQNPARSGLPQLTLAQLIVYAETAVVCFALPILLAVVFIGLAWTGVLTQFYPFGHLALLALFFILFFDALGRAHHRWQAPSVSEAKRRVEEASGLTHRPLDTVEDRPIAAEAEAYPLWQEHVERARLSLDNLAWPRWTLKLAEHDPYRLRYVAAVVLIVGLMIGWGALGGRMIAAINPALAKLPLNTATVDAWITPPDYTHMAPIMIATPAGNRFQDQVVRVPEGSVLHVHVAEKDGAAPTLTSNGQDADLVAEDGKDFGISQKLTGGEKIILSRGWATLGSWKINIVPDMAPEIAFSDPPTVTERKDLRISYNAKDDYGVTSVTLQVTPRESLLSADSGTKSWPLSANGDKEIKRVDFKDLTAEPAAGTLVDLQLVAMDAAGHQSVSNTISFTLPERAFFHPVARALIEERKKLIQDALNTSVRNEAANVMAGLAHQPSAFNNDALVMMALRAGAVRLILDNDREAVVSATDILWQSAVRIEEGTTGLAADELRQAQHELADALDRNASEAEVQSLIDRMHQAFARYMAELSTRVAAHNPQSEDLNQIMGARTNVLTPQDLERMLEDMKNLSASGDRDAARQELAKMQEALENIQSASPELSMEQRAALERIKQLRTLITDQQKLLDATFQKAQNLKDSVAPLAPQQSALESRLKAIMQGQDNAQMRQGDEAMGSAEKNLRQNSSKAAMDQQNAALKALQQMQDKMSDELSQNLFALPLPSRAQQDPFGRNNGSMMSHSDVDVPDRVDAPRARQILDEIQRRAGDMSRPKSERDYIERLLQNF